DATGSLLSGRRVARDAASSSNKCARRMRGAGRSELSCDRSQSEGSVSPGQTPIFWVAVRDGKIIEIVEPAASSPGRRALYRDAGNPAKAPWAHRRPLARRA